MSASSLQIDSTSMGLLDQLMQFLLESVRPSRFRDGCLKNNHVRLALHLNHSHTIKSIFSFNQTVMLRLQ